MTFDGGLAQRIRELLHDRGDVVEKRMFGGLAFMVGGHMTVGVSASSLLARVGPANHAHALATAHVRPMDFTGRPMKGYVFVDPEGLASDGDLATWIRVCCDFVATLPARAPRR